MNYLIINLDDKKIKENKLGLASKRSKHSIKFNLFNVLKKNISSRLHRKGKMYIMFLVKHFTAVRYY